MRIDRFKSRILSHEDIGQLNTYVSWHKKKMTTDGDNPPVGILLCTQKDYTLLDRTTFLPLKKLTTRTG
ncbi:MAG: hypothetical protein DRH24_08490 [Deltaproteobacteria bacterium]|nr:MAG: hypothetical protein DRH24_08490 [Deltaproteobacteria bacterium]